MRENKVKIKIENGEIVFGIYSVIPSPDMIELAGICGMDYVRIDCHHGSLNMETVANMIRAAELVGVTPFVRVYNDPQRILSVLDMGAMGVIVPDISNAEEARAAVESAKYHPIGGRGLFSNSRASNYGDFSGKKYIEWANKNIMVGLQIENKSAIDNIEEILSVEGIDFIMSGRNDLSQSLGVGGHKNHPLVLEVEERIANAATKANVMVTLNMNPYQETYEDTLKNLINNGSKMITLGTDISSIIHIYKSTIKKLKKNSLK